MTNFAHSPVNEDFEDPVKMVERQLGMIGLHDLSHENNENAAPPTISRSIDSHDSREVSRGRSESLGSGWSDGEDHEMRRRSRSTGDGGDLPSESDDRTAVSFHQRFHAASPLHRDHLSSGPRARPAGGLDTRYLLKYDVPDAPDTIEIPIFGSTRRSANRRRSKPPNAPRRCAVWEDTILPTIPECWPQEHQQDSTNTSTAGGYGGEEEEETEEKHDGLFKRSASFMSLPSVFKPSTYRKKQRGSFLTEEQAQEKIKASPKLQQLFSWAVEELPSGDGEGSAFSGDDGRSGLSNAELLRRAEGYVKDWEAYKCSDEPIARELPVHLVEKLRERMTKEEFEDPISVAKSALRMHPIS